MQPMNYFVVCLMGFAHNQAKGVITMEVKRIPKDSWCVVCDNELAEFEISHNGSLRPFWCNHGDGEIGLCKYCFAELKRQINSL